MQLNKKISSLKKDLKVFCVMCRTFSALDSLIYIYIYIYIIYFTIVRVQSWKLKYRKLVKRRKMDFQVCQLARSELDNTFVLVTSDHGYNLGNHMLATAKMQAYDHALRIPMIFAGPVR